MKFITGEDELTQLSTDIEAASFPDCFPEATELQLIRRGRLSCLPSSPNCSLLLTSAETVQPAELSGVGAPSDTSANRIKMGGTVAGAKIKFSVKPVYPLEARANG
ncbi:MAG: hypothetical protein DMG38_04675 [Acidobacteria bacterium]|nr:MAG: hypothetical protein DMG38_04675 [Acidobacteriota bacterium]